MAIEQSWLRSSGLYSLVGDARKGLATSNQGRWRVAWVHCICMRRTWPASDRDWDGSQAVANSSSRLLKEKGDYFEHSGSQPALINFRLTCICCVFVHLRLCFVCCKLPFVSTKYPTCVSLHNATWFYTVGYSASMLKVRWEIFPTFSVAKSKATWLKFRKILLIILLITQ